MPKKNAVSPSEKYPRSHRPRQKLGPGKRLKLALAERVNSGLDRKAEEYLAPVINETTATIPERSSDSLDRRDSRPTAATYRNRRIGAGLVAVATVGVATAAGGNLITNGDGKVQSRETSSIEREALSNPKVAEGELLISAGTKIRHEPIIMQADTTAGLDDDDVKPAFTVQDGQRIKVVNPLIGGDNDEFYGFQLKDSDKIENGIYWVAKQTGGQLNDDGVPFTQFVTPLEYALFQETDITAFVNQTENGLDVVGPPGISVGQASISDSPSYTS